MNIMTDTDHLDKLLAAVEQWQHVNLGWASRALIETKDLIKREREQEAVKK